MTHTPSDAAPPVEACEAHREAIELLRVHRDLGVALSAVSDLEAALDAILAASLKVSGADAAGIYLVTPDRSGIELVVHGGLSQQFVTEARYYRAGTPQYDVVMARKPVYDARAYSGGVFPPLCANEGLRALMITPVISEQEVLACLNIASRHLDSFSPAAQHALESIAEHIGSVLRRVEADERRRAAEAKLFTIIHNSPYAYVETDMAGKVTACNARAAELAGLSMEELCGRDMAEFLGEADLARVQVNMERMARDKAATLDEYTVQLPSGEQRLLETVAHPLLHGGEVCGFFTMMLDVTEKVEAIRLERQALRQVIDFHERDRRALAYDVHDGLAQKLTAIGLLIESYQRTLPTAPDKAAALLTQMRQWVGDVLKSSRRLISGLRPPILDEWGVVPAIEYLINERHMEGGPRIDFDPNVSFDRLAAPLESAVFRIVEEALRNACRHSGSERITVGLSDADSRIDLSVEDWGRGFDLAQVEEEEKFGLQRIRAHVRILGGQLSITSAVGQGTRIAAALPLLPRLPE